MRFYRLRRLGDSPAGRILSFEQSCWLELCLYEEILFTDHKWMERVSLPVIGWISWVVSNTKLVWEDVMMIDDSE